MQDECCNGHCNQGRSCPKRAHAPDGSILDGVLGYLGGLVTAVMIVFCLFVILYLFMPGL